MNSFWAVFKRELKSYFSTPLAYVFLVVFLFCAGYMMFRNGFYEDTAGGPAALLHQPADAVRVYGPGDRHAALG